MNEVANRPSPAAERMRRHRERRRDGLRCLLIELRITEIDALIRRGLLTSETRNDPGAVCDAIYLISNKRWAHTGDAYRSKCGPAHLADKNSP